MRNILRCEFKNCRWPDCEGTCGLTNGEKPNAHHSAEESLIYHLQGEISKRDREITRLRNALSAAIQNLSYDLDRGLTKDNEYRNVCIHGYSWCTNNPAYLRDHNTDYWKAIGMPTHCTLDECYAESEDK